MTLSYFETTPPLRRVRIASAVGAIALALAASVPIVSAQDAGVPAAAAESEVSATKPEAEAGSMSRAETTLPGDRITPGDLAAAVASGALSLAQLAELKSEFASGELSSGQLDDLSSRLGSLNLSSDDLNSIMSSLGLSDEQKAELLKRLGARPKRKQLDLLGMGRSFPVPPSAIERAFHSLDSPERDIAPSPEQLEQFGYSLFSAKVSTFAPVDKVPVGDEYIVGPGDELKVLMWGRVNQDISLQVDRDGQVQIPQLGPLQVAGLTFAQAKKLIETDVRQVSGVDLSVTMGQLRTIQVFVVGEVDLPGAYTVSSLSRISNALLAAGGIRKTGSLRRVELRRGNRVARVVDLYRILMHGETSGDVRLEEGDTVFVPVIGTVAGVVGDVKRPAIYELGRDWSLENTLKLAGGISAFGYTQRVQVERISNHQRRIVLDVNPAEISLAKFQVQDGDLVKVYPVLHRQTELVELKGNANRPGKYQWVAGMRVADLIREGEGLQEKTFYRYAVIQRTLKDHTVKMIPVNLEEALSDHLATPGNVSLEAGDVLTVLNEDEVKDQPSITVYGEVRKPGSYPLLPGMQVSDLIYSAGGLEDDAYLEQAQLARTTVIDGRMTDHRYINVDLRQALASTSRDVPLQINDVLFIRRVPGWHLPWVVQLEGQVKKPGPYTITRDEKLSALLSEAGGLQPDAYLPAAIFTRKSILERQQQRLDESRSRIERQIERLTLDSGMVGQNRASNQSETDARAQQLQFLERILSEAQSTQATGRLVVRIKSLDALANLSEDVVLENGDKLIIPKRPSEINILGQVYNPTAVLYQPALTVRDYLDRAGGPEDGADKGNIFVIKADGSVLTQAAQAQARLFPLLPAVGGGLMSARLSPGDTVYVPEKLIFVDNLQITRDVTQIIAQSVTSLAILGILASNL